MSVNGPCFSSFFRFFDVPEPPPDPAPGRGRTGVEKGTPGMPWRVAREGLRRAWVGGGGLGVGVGVAYVVPFVANVVVIVAPTPPPPQTPPRYCARLSRLGKGRAGAGRTAGVVRWPLVIFFLGPKPKISLGGRNSPRGFTSAKRQNSKKNLPQPCQIDPSINPTHLWPSWASS